MLAGKLLKSYAEKSAGPPAGDRLLRACGKDEKT